MLFTDDHNCLVIRGKTKHGLRREVRFWADRGIIHCEDSLDNSYNTMSVRSFLLRTKGLSEMLGRSAVGDDVGADADLREETQRIVDKAADIARQAQIQGMPEDASARRDLVRRRSKTICVAAGKAIL